VHLSRVTSEGHCSARFGGGFDVEAENDVIADEIIGFAGVFHLEIHTVDGELGGESDGVILDGNFGGERYLFGDAMESEVSGDFGVVARAGDGGGFENSGGMLRDVEEVRALEVAGEAILVRPEGGSVDGDFGVGDGVVGGVDFALELFEAPVVLARDLGAGEFDFGTVGGDRVGLGPGRWSGCSGGGLVRARDVRGGNFISRIGAGDEQCDGESEEEDFHGFHRYYHFFGVCRSAVVWQARRSEREGGEGARVSRRKARGRSLRAARGDMTHHSRIKRQRRTLT
jgi:hypothetical protein